MRRQFDHTTTMEAGRPVPAYAIACRCGATDTVKATNHSGGLPSDIIQKKFVAKGWTIGRKSQRCPACSDKIKLVKPETAMTTPAANVELPQREMTPADKRHIFREIDEHWNEKMARYDGLASDHSIAAKLDVPRIWVKALREENFGASGANESFDKLAAETAGLREQFGQLATNALTLAEQYEKMAAEFRKLEDRIRAASI